MLASKSAVRRSVLEAAGVPVEIAAADIDERGIEARAGLTDPSEIASVAGAREGAGGFGEASRPHGARRRPDACAWASGGFPRRRTAPPRASSCGVARQDPCAAFGGGGAVRGGNVAVRARRSGAADDAGVLRRVSRQLSRRGRRRGDWRASAAISSKAAASNCSSASRAIISPCLACRCCRCWTGCGSAGCWRSEASCS